MLRRFRNIASCIVLLSISTSTLAYDQLTITRNTANFFAATHIGQQKIDLRCALPNPYVTIINITIGRKIISVEINNRTETVHIGGNDQRISESEKMALSRAQQTIAYVLQSQDIDYTAGIKASQKMLHYLAASPADLLSAKTFAARDN